MYKLKNPSHSALSLWDHRKCNPVTSSNYSGCKDEIMDRRALRCLHQTVFFPPYDFLISYFPAAGQAQCKSCQELRWARLCLCVRTGSRVCVHADLRQIRVLFCRIRTHAYTTRWAAAALFSASSPHLLARTKLKGCLFAIWWSFDTNVCRRHGAFLHNSFVFNANGNYAGSPSNPLIFPPVGLTHWWATLHEYKTLFFLTSCFTHRLAVAISIYMCLSAFPL